MFLDDLAKESGYGNQSFGDLLYVLTQVLQPHRVLETGYNKGYSSFKICSAMHYGKMASVDIRPCDGGGIIHEQKFKVEYRFFHGDSKLINKDVITFLQEIDLLFIDGDHSYLGCKGDWDTYSPYLTPNAVVLIHDNYDSDIKRAISEINDWNFVDVGASLSFGRRADKEVIAYDAGPQENSTHRYYVRKSGQKWSLFENSQSVYCKKIGRFVKYGPSCVQSDDFLFNSPDEALNEIKNSQKIGQAGN